MPKILVTDRQGAEHEVEATNGFTLMEAIRDGGNFELTAICGGMLSCSTCHVYIDEAWLDKMPPQKEDEHDLVADSFHYQPTSRLSCQIPITGALEGLRVTVAPED
jgi:2Fe-2S ferredoxin